MTCNRKSHPFCAFNAPALLSITLELAINERKHEPLLFLYIVRQNQRARHLCY